METTETTIRTLPTGIDAVVSAQANATAWRIWRTLAAEAAGRGVGLCFTPTAGAGVEVTTVGSPLWEAMHISISPTGEISDMSEQSCPFDLLVRAN